MKEIPLSQGKVAFVDDADYEWLSRWKWFAHRDYRSQDTYYAVRHVSKGKIIAMHSLIAATPVGMVTDHIDHNGLNNQRSNLRVCSRSENMFNQRVHSNNTSGYKGVSWNKVARKWDARIAFHGKRLLIGYFDTIEDASRAYDSAAQRLHGDFAVLNG